MGIRTIIIDINISPKRKCRTKRKMFIRNKADNASILKHLDNFKNEYRVLRDNMKKKKKKKNAVYLIKTDLEATLRLIQVANM